MAPSRHDIHRMCANHYLFQRYDDEANQALIVVQSTLGNYLGPFILPLLILNAYEHWSLVHKSSTRSWTRGLW